MAVRPLDEYYSRDSAVPLYRPRYLPDTLGDWWHLLTTEPSFKLPSPHTLLSRLAYRCIMALPWSHEFRERIDPALAYQRGYERALVDTGKRSALARLHYYHACRTALLQLLRATDDVDDMPNPDNMDVYDICLEAARTALEESNPILEFHR